MKNQSVWTRRTVLFIPFAIMLLSLFLSGDTVCAGVTSLPDFMPMPVEYPGDAEEAYYKLLCELISEYGIAQDDRWNSYKGSPGVEWAAVSDLSSDGVPEFAVAISRDMGEDSWQNECELTIYSYDSGYAEMLDWFDIQYRSQLKIVEHEGSLCIQAERIFYNDDGTYNTNGAFISVQKDEVLAEPVEENQNMYVEGAHNYDGFAARYNSFIYMNHDLYQTIIDLTGIEPAACFPGDNSWESLYQRFLNTDSNEHDCSRYALKDITGDGVPELFGSSIGNSEPATNYFGSNCCIITYTGNHIRFLVTNGFDVAYRDGEAATDLGSLGHYHGIFIYSLINSDIELQKSIEMSYSAAFDEIYYYLVDSVSVSEDDYHSILDQYDLEYAFGTDSEGNYHESSWETASRGLSLDDMLSQLSSETEYEYSFNIPWDPNAGYQTQYMVIPDTFPDDENEHFFNVLLEKIDQYGVCLRDEEHGMFSSGVLWAKMFDISGNDDKEFALLYTYTDESGIRRYFLEIYDNYSSEAGIVYEAETAPTERPSIGICDGKPCMSIQLTDGSMQRLTMLSGEIVDLGADVPYTENSQPSGLTGYYDAGGTYILLDSDLYDAFEELTGIDPSSVRSESSDTSGGNVPCFATSIVAKYAGYLDDPELGLISGNQVPGSESCSDMNSGYAYALKLLIDQYGFTYYHRITETYQFTEGIYSADLFGTNPEGNPYLIVGREPYKTPGSLCGYAYVFSWEKGILNYIGIPNAGNDFWLSNIAGSPALVSHDEGAMQTGVYMLDGSGRILWYGNYYKDGVSWSGNEDDRKETWYFENRVSEAYDVQEYQSYLKNCRTNWNTLRCYIDPDGAIRFVSGTVLDTYETLSGGRSLTEKITVNIQLTWMILYQRILEPYSGSDSMRSQLLYLDEDDIPELVLQDYESGSVTVITSDGRSVEAVSFQDNGMLKASDRSGSFLIGADLRQDTITYYSYMMIFTIDAGRFRLTNMGYCDPESGTFLWNGRSISTETSFMEELEKLLPGLVFFWPGEELSELLDLIQDFPPGTVLSVTLSWSEEEADTFREECSADGYGSDYDDYEDSYSDDDSYDDDSYDYDDYEDDDTSYPDASDDWDAVEEAGLTAGEPVTVSGDLYTDGQERYKETGYILPQSASRYLTEEDIAHLTMKGCCYARNEIYARHGRLFSASELQTYFDDRDWYEGYIDPDDFDEEYTKSVFNEYEYANAYFLLTYEQEHGMYWPE